MLLDLFLKKNREPTVKKKFYEEKFNSPIIKVKVLNVYLSQ